MDALRQSQATAEELGAAWFRAMRRGDFAAAWQASDAILRAHAGVPCWHRPRHEQWVWDGTPLDGKRVLVRCYHGLGDTIQFIRYLPLVKQIAAETIVWAQSALIPLLRTAGGIDRLEPLHDGAFEGEYDVDVEVMELAHVFRSTIDTLPNRVPYLHAEPAPLARDGRLAVGLVWRAGDWDERRSIPFHLLAPLAEIPGIDLHVLQRGAALDECPADFGTHSGADDVVEAARVIRALDLVITVDSMPAHLAGALGVPVWTLLIHEADWRWMVDREDSPWYPTMRLFRQPTPGDWSPVLRRVAAELHALAAGRAVAKNGRGDTLATAHR
ncbi:MAG TPA: glycosyltransferase family 9 protein [Longimicrobium sp.]|nr:glycosyltransferase family 9 protein [Longimicrobium sp.]